MKQDISRLKYYSESISIFFRISNTVEDVDSRMLISQSIQIEETFKNMEEVITYDQE